MERESIKNMLNYIERTSDFPCLNDVRYDVMCSVNIPSCSL